MFGLRKNYVHSHPLKLKLVLRNSTKPLNVFLSLSLSLPPRTVLKQINKPARTHTHTYTLKIDTHTHTFKGRVGMRTYITTHKHLEENNNTNKRATKPWPLEAATAGLKL